ncbi:type VI secretion-associated protein [Rhodovulum sulfidophilum]|nr:type VI secretion system-associated protein TagF [Rhodovulum visakhapatnamense]OLS45497.1 type VI secretion-associated protein [Rhodovulum sulfidophilum]
MPGHRGSCRSGGPVTPATGFFGKIPSAGDFVTQGVPGMMRIALDRWMTAHLATRSAWPGSWPETGLRATLELGKGTLTALILPSRDRSGRAFPLACCRLPGLDWDAAEEWCDAALPTARAAVAGALSPGSLGAALEALPPARGIDPEPGLWIADPPAAENRSVEQVLAALMGPIGAV